MKSVFTTCQKALTVLMTLTALLICGSAYAQNVINGKVVDGAGEPVIGAAVMIPGTTTGTVTDIDGSFQINVAAGTDLEISCIGYTTLTVKAANNMSVVLTEDSTMLEETVVIGYGTVKVKDLTGSVSTVGSKDLEFPTANVAEALQGKMAGVVISMNDGTPGGAPQIRVRGSKSITQSNDPLYIVDGFPVSDLSGIPSNQIKSINVLKDAAATAIYGSRGAAGVIIVTTKNALEGQTQVSYNGFVQVKDSSTGIREVLEPLDYLKFTLGYARDFNSSGYIDMLKYFGMSDAYGNNYGNNYSKYAAMQSHNYQKDLYRTAIAHNHDISISNGTKKNKTMFNMGFINDDGTVINSYFRRVNASLKTIENLTDNFNIELNVSYTYMNSRRGAGNSSAAYRYKPIDTPLGDPTNTVGFGMGATSYIEDSHNPVAVANDTQDQTKNHIFRGIGAINWTIIPDLKLRSEIGLSKAFRKNEGYKAGKAGGNNNEADLRQTETSNLHWTTTLSYDLPFKNENHRADIMLGNEIINSNSSNMYMYGKTYPGGFDRETTLAMMNQFIDSSTMSTTVDMPGRSISFFGRLNYSFKDRYLFTATLRADGSSKFSPNNRWGYFPAAAFAWRVIDEPWMSDSKNWLSNLKVRLSYGSTGSDAINANLWKESWSLSSGTSNYTISQQRKDTALDYGYFFSPGAMMLNDDLKWETTITRNLGIDFGFLDERIYGVIEGYWSTTKDLLMPVNINVSTGYTHQYQNMGQISNKGIEFSIGGDIVRKNDFRLSANLIYNYNHNNIDKLAPTVQVNSYGQWVGGRPALGEYKLLEGYPIGTISAFKSQGWFTPDDFDYDPATKMYTLKPGIPDYKDDSYYSPFNKPKGQNAFPGCIKYEDVDGDGVRGTDDDYVVGCMTPHSTGSFNLNMVWKGFDLSANFNYVIGGMLMNCQSGYSVYGSKDNYFGANRMAFVKTAYSPYKWNANGELEAVTDPAELNALNANATMHTPTSYCGYLLDTFLEDASFLRLKNLTLGYTIPSNLTQKIKVSNIRLYFTAGNLLTFTKYTGLDPEVNTNRTNGGGYPSPGVDREAYPIARTYTFGLNITL